jgi:small subunit ribosomal protein S7
MKISTKNEILPAKFQEITDNILQSHKMIKVNEKESSMYSFLHAHETRLMNRFINFLTKKGKKSKAQNIFYDSLKILFKLSYEKIVQSDEVPNSKIFNIFDEAISNIQPLFEVKKVRIAGTTYQVPALISQKRQENKAMNWLLESTKERKKKESSQSFQHCLAIEIYDAFLKQGYARQKRNELHKLAESNRAFSHFRWW